MATEAELVSKLRIMLGDDDPTKNHLNNYEYKYTDPQLKFFLEFALNDINTANPATNFTYDDFDQITLLINGAMIFSQIASGILQMDNQLDYNDAGFSISMFNKSPMKQSWIGFLLQMYISGLRDLKQGIIMGGNGSGFVGVRSGFSYDYGGDYR